MRIIGPASAPYEQVESWAYRNTQGLFQNLMLPALWSEAERLLIDPVGVVAQSYRETAAGAFTGIVKAQFYNTCGLKIRHLGIMPEANGDYPLAHQMFPSWQVGARAHVQHVAAYAGLPIPHDIIVDPRYTYVAGKHACENWEDLGGKWAPAADYGQRIENVIKQIQSWSM